MLEKFENYEILMLNAYLYENSNLLLGVKKFKNCFWKYLVCAMLYNNIIMLLSCIIVGGGCYV